MSPSPSSPSALSAHLDEWSAGLARFAPSAPALRPPLIPHLARAADRLLEDTWCSLNLAHFAVSQELVRARSEKLFPPDPTDPWPAPDPSRRIKAPETRDFLPGEIDPLVLAALDGYLACQRLFKLTVMRLLQGADLTPTLQKDLPHWYQTLMQPSSQAGLLTGLDMKRGRTQAKPAFPLHHQPPAPQDITACLDVLLTHQDLLRYPALAHLGLLWIQPWTRGNGRMARLLMSALMLASGQSWVIIAADRRESYLAALQAAFTNLDCAPWASLIAACHT